MIKLVRIVLPDRFDDSLERVFANVRSQHDGYTWDKFLSGLLVILLDQLPENDQLAPKLRNGKMPREFLNGYCNYCESFHKAGEPHRSKI